MIGIEILEERAAADLVAANQVPEVRQRVAAPDEVLPPRIRVGEKARQQRFFFFSRLRNAVVDGPGRRGILG
jgi:hypothetical protein